MAVRAARQKEKRPGPEGAERTRPPQGLTSAAFAAESRGYADVEKHWGKEYIDTVTEKGLIDGKTAAAFAPDENMTRAGLVLALYRLAGSPSGSGRMRPAVTYLTYPQKRHHSDRLAGRLTLFRVPQRRRGLAFI